LSAEITGIVIKFYRGCIFHNRRKSYGRFRRGGTEEDWESLCKECFIKANRSPSFRAVYELRILSECCYSDCCVKFPKCPIGHGDSTENYSCLKFEGETL